MFILSLLFIISYASGPCDCVQSWEFKGSIYKGCDPAAPKDKKPWCYVDGDGCADAKESTVKSGEFWRYCDVGMTSGTSVTHMVVVTKGDSGSATAYSGSGNPNEPPEDNAPAPAPAVPAPAAPQAEAEDDDASAGKDFKPLHKTMSEGRLLRKLWAEMNQIESLIHAANVDLKARLIKAFKVVRNRMVEWEKVKDDTSAKKTEGQRLRAMWAAMGAIEDEIHEINVAMKKRLQGLIEALRSKMHIFDAAAARIDRMRLAQGKGPGVVASSASAAAGGSADSNNPCPPGEVAIAGAEGSVSCGSDPKPNPNGVETAIAAVPAWRRHLEEDVGADMGEMAPLVKTVSEGAKLRALWAELGGIEKEIHETNLVLKARLLAAFKVIRARMANWEKEGSPDKKKSEGARLRAQWAELGKVEEQIHITNQEMKRRLRRVIRVIKTKMEHFEKGAEEAKKLEKAKNPAKPGRSGKKVPELANSME